MLYLVAITFALFCIDSDNALPVPDIMNSGDRWNFLLLGGVSVIGMGAILACVRCRRKKRGFEEFKNNDAPKASTTRTTVEAIRTEFPIFQALSTPSSPQFQPLDNESRDDSRDNLDRVNQVDMLDEKKNNTGSEESWRNEETGSVGEEKIQSRGVADLYLVPDETIVLTFDAPPDDKEGEKYFTYQELPAPTMNEEKGVKGPLSDEGQLNESSPPSLPEDTEYETSVAQALRELDIAIGDGADSEEEDANEVAREEANESEDEEQHLENVLRQLFIDNMMSSLSSAEVEQEANPGMQPAELSGSGRDTPTEEQIQMTEANNFFADLPAICQSTPSVIRGRVDGAEDRPKPLSLFAGCESPPAEPEADGTFVVPTVQVLSPGENPAVDQTFEVNVAAKEEENRHLKDVDATITPVNTPIEVTFEVADRARGETAGGGGEGEVTFTKDLDGMEGPSTSKAPTGWFLHPQDETFDFENLPPPPPPLDGYYGEYDDNDDEEGGFGSRGNTDFDALRKQLADLLPHAQGAPAVDDEGAVGGSCESGMSADILEAMLNNMDPSPTVVAEPTNYKRPLSPIMEESEEENTTIKTSLLNDTTKNLDSTSTGCIETLSEAVMGVTRTLMASNDTLFNFEDTLGDREDLTPTPTVSGAYSNVPQSPINNVTRTLNETFDQENKAVDATFVQEERVSSRPSMTLDLAAVRADNYSSALDVLSPEQQKTFSEDIVSVEHVSGSDASGNVDPDGTYTTNTIEMETCISLNKDEEGEDVCEPVEELEKDDQHEKEQNYDDDYDEESLDSKEEETVDEVSVKAEAPVENGEAVKSPVDPVEQTKLFLAREIDFNRWHKVSSNCVDTAAVFYVQTVEQQVPVLELEKCVSLKNTSSEWDADDTFLMDGRGKEANNIVTFDFNENCTNGFEEENADARLRNNLSGEEDPWGTEEVHENNDEEEMVTVFNSEWQKREDEDSDNNEGSEGDEEDGQSVSSSGDSSEEFMYVSATKSNGENIRKPNPGGSAAWESHVDQVPVAKKEEKQCPIVHEEDEEDCDGAGGGGEDEDGEFIPSSWNSNAKPSRSAMKSPDKSSSDEDSKESNKRPRSVAFKKQQYHSVYEYPREMNPLSPSLSEPSFSINFRDQMMMNNNVHSAIGDIDGFMISSSTRPFQSNQCNTWPTESDFSWSQHMPEAGESPLKGTEGTVVYSEIPIEWPRKVVIVDGEADDSESESSTNPLPRPDSGVWESAEFLNDTGALGELCHQKGSLRLPLAIVPPAAVTVINSVGELKEDSDEELRKEEEDNMGLPTPSCTGSMDSLSSSSCSDRQIASFTTFGKVTPQDSVEDTKGEVKLTVEGVQVEENGHADEEELKSGSHEGLKSGTGDADKLGHKRVSDSTDEDSGIENISRRIN